MWQGFRSVRQWITYVGLAVIAWIVTLLVLMTAIIALAFWFVGSLQLG